MHSVSIYRGSALEQQQCGLRRAFGIQQSNVLGLPASEPKGTAVDNKHRELTDVRASQKAAREVGQRPRNPAPRWVLAEGLSGEPVTGSQVSLLCALTQSICPRPCG